jgi:hypothetical protein
MLAVSPQLSAATILIAGRRVRKAGGHDQPIATTNRVRTLAPNSVAKDTETPKLGELRGSRWHVMQCQQHQDRRHESV